MHVGEVTKHFFMALIIGLNVVIWGWFLLGWLIEHAPWLLLGLPLICLLLLSINPRGREKID